MRRAKEAAIIGILAVLVLAFFFAPIGLWFNSGSPTAELQYSIPNTWPYPIPTPRVPVYRSLGCATAGIGDLYAPLWFGFNLGCSLPNPPPPSTTPTVAPNDRISLPSGVAICSSNCVYPAPYLSATVLVNASSPLVNLHLFINGTDEGIVGSFDNTLITYGYILKANPHNASLPIQAGKIYYVELVATFRDGTTSTTTASAVADYGSG